MTWSHAGVRREVEAVANVSRRGATLLLSCGHQKRLTSSSGILPKVSHCIECEENA
jgi:hypothetical protein